ncbi:hypothetical protein CHS0354_039712 [Potamilus streckersoni]|uniref:Uncharacterized protein n=1 Tax=Potamilus streckersoni TaxID=2493646 RepID=A0AAE0VVI2_9BIVA|nr:hypothetical protein CHS0354_039712 [Potamilus streckersoni]
MFEDAQTTVLDKDTMIEVLLQKIKELEKNQEECSKYQSRMLLELNNVRDKLEQSERRISVLEDTVYEMKTDEYTENVNVTNEDDPVYYPLSKDVAKVLLGETNISRTPEPKAMHSHKPGKKCEWLVRPFHPISLNK